MQNFLASLSRQQTPQYLAGSGDFRINPNDGPITVKLTDFNPTPGDFIAKGGFGIVYQARFRDQLDVARKICKIRDLAKNATFRGGEEDITQECWYRELTFHQSCTHDHIVRLHGFIVRTVSGVNASNRPNELQLFLELMTCSYREILHCFPLPEDLSASTPFRRDGIVQVLPFRAFLKHVCSGLEYLHSASLMHRDFKPGNVLLRADNGAAVVKIADFGTIKDYNNTTQGDEMNLHSADPGTTKYSAPEVISCHNQAYTVSCDVWSLGITCVHLIAAYHPIVTDGERSSFSCSSNSAYCRSISREEDIFTDLPEKVGLNGSLADILGRCLDRSPELRPSVKDILEEVGDVEDDKQSLFYWFIGLDIEQRIRNNRRMR